MRRQEHADHTYTHVRDKRTPFERVAEAQPKATALNSSCEKRPLRLWRSNKSMPPKLSAHIKLSPDVQ